MTEKEVRARRVLYAQVNFGTEADQNATPPPVSATPHALGDKGLHLAFITFEGDTFSHYMIDNQQPATPMQVDHRDLLDEELLARAEAILAEYARSCFPRVRFTAFAITFSWL